MARILVLLFLIATISFNILQVKNICARQSNDILQEFNPTDSASFFNIREEIWCWETYVGSEFYKLVLIDFVLQFPFLLYELCAKLLYKYYEIKFFNFAFDMETKFLDLLYIQTVFWLSIYFSPFLGVFAPFFYIVKFYSNLVSRINCYMAFFILN